MSFRCRGASGWPRDGARARCNPSAEDPLAPLAPLLLLVLAGSPPASAPAPPDLRTARVVDLTWPFDAQTLYWPSEPANRFELREVARSATPHGWRGWFRERWFNTSNAYCAPEHGGTHLDAPIHFAEEGWTAEKIPVDRLVAPAVVIDLTARAAANRDAELAVGEVLDWEARHGRIPRGAIVLLRTGWGARWPDAQRFFGNDGKHLHFPSYGVAAAELLARDRKVAALGVDTASVDPGRSEKFRVHRLAFAENVVALENVAHLEALPEAGAWVIALPMKIAGGSGGPLRIVALVAPDQAIAGATAAATPGTIPGR